MKVGGTEIRSIVVEVNPLEVLEKLYKKVISELNIPKDCDKDYSFVSIVTTKDTVEQRYIKEGYSYGHYDKDDKVVLVKEVTNLVGEETLEYINSLKVVIGRLRGEE
jgi:translation initiation factor 2 beta subunit (eIF-2beta)/eIF-5